MDKKQFVERVAHGGQYSSQDRGWLKAMASKYPFSSVVALHALLADKAYGFDTPEQHRAVALAMCDAHGLEAMLASAQQAQPTQPAQPAQQSQPAPSTEIKRVADNGKFDILSEINTFQEVSFKTAPKSVILSNFLPEEAQEDLAAQPAKVSSNDLTDKKSLQPNEALGTETLAIILEKQGNYARALAIYKNLLARNPEKSSTFAARIEHLESLIIRK